MFPYPSASGLHVGYPLGYTATDIYSRYKRLQGYNVLHPIGWDAFGLPAEQYAIKTGTHPKETTKTSEGTPKTKQRHPKATQRHVKSPPNDPKTTKKQGQAKGGTHEEPASGDRRAQAPAQEQRPRELMPGKARPGPPEAHQKARASQGGDPRS